MATTDRTGELRATLQEILPALVPQADRDTRIEAGTHGTLWLCMSDAGEGEFSRAITEDEASILIEAGVARDAR